MSKIKRLAIRSLIVGLALILVGCAGRAPNIAIPSKMPAPVEAAKHPNVVLVLGGGGARGYAHIGVLKVLQKAGIPVDMVVTASAGSIVGALYADNLNANKVSQIMLNASFWDFADVSNLPSLKGPVEGYRLQKFLLHNMHARWFKDLKIPLVVATTQLQSGKLFSIASGPIPPAIEASAAVPGVVQPVHLYGRTLIDGGIIDPLPVDIAKRYHPKIIIAVNIANELSKWRPKTAWGIYDRSTLISWLAFSRLEEKDADIVIRPHVGSTGIFDLSKKQEMILAGEKAAKQALPKIKKLLREKHILATASSYLAP